MNFGKNIAGSSVLATVLLSTTALADVGSRDVWESWRGYLSGFGYDISASESTDGDTLSVTDLTLGMAIPDEEGTISINMGDLQFVENGDGTVTIIMPEQMPMHVVADADGEAVDAVVTVSHSGLSTIVSGTPDEMTYTYNASELGVALTSLVVDGEQMPDDMVVNAIMGGVAGQSKVLIGETIATQQKMHVDTLNYVVKAADPEGAGALDLKGSMAGLDMDVDGVVPLGDYADDPAAMFGAGFDIAGTYSMDASDMAFLLTEDGTPTNVAITSGEASMSVEMNDTLMAYSGAMANVKFSGMGPDIPLPIDVEMGEFGYGIELPMKAGPQPQDFIANLTFGDLAVSEMIWGMVDPGQVLPHDPATLIIDLVGKATVFTDIMTMDENSDDVPGELNAMTIKDLQLHIAGASLTGMGDFTFDNSDMESFDGMPRPEGMLDLNIQGVNGLMDKLVQMGLLPEDQVMGARMMLSMIAVPGEGEDELNSQIEINEQGHILANGQRLK